ncbi:MAG: hypothetical protein IPO62_00285 [Saprospiraceae bacterium]|nr:hypothetical protein [Saprospiraceae bacterium]
MKQVIVYFMHEKEETMASSIISSITEKTESFFKGEVTDDDIKNLAAKNLIFSIIDPREQPVSQGETLPKGKEKAIFKNKVLLRDIKLEEEVSKGINYYKIKVDGPLTTSILSDLRKHGIEINTQISNNAYTVKLDSDQHDLLNKHKDMLSIQLYSKVDTGVREIEKDDLYDHFLNKNIYERNTIIEKSIDASGKEISKEIEAKVYDVFLHDIKDKGALVQWLKDMGIEILGLSKFKIRIKTIPSDKIYLEIVGNPLVQNVYEYIPPTLHDFYAKQIINSIYANGHNYFNILILKEKDKSLVLRIRVSMINMVI